MYVKVFPQILESSLSVDYEQRHIFEDLLKLADREGVVDMTIEAIARRINVAVEVVERNVRKLEQPDPHSRSENEEGRRIVRLASHRDWGWQVVNYVFYRDLIDAEALRVANRERKREQRAREKARLNGHNVSQNVRDSHVRSQNVTLSESEAFSVSDTNSEKQNKPPTPLQGVVVFPVNLDSDRFKKAWALWRAHRTEKRKKLTPTQEQKQLDRLETLGPDRAIAAIDYSIAQGWTGIFEETFSVAPNKNGSQKPAAPQFVTREKVANWCSRKGWTKLTETAWGKLMGGTYYGKAITNEVDFNAAMSAIYEDTDP